MDRLFVIPELSGTNPESSFVLSVQEDATTKTEVGSINDRGMVDKVATARFFQYSVTWPTTVTRQIITEVYPRIAKAAKGR
jgi:hypothetical protein